MTQIAPIVIKDGSTTPADVTFVPYQPQSGSDVALWFLATAESRDKWTRLTLSVRKTPNKAMRHKLGFNIPYFDAQGVQVGSIPFTGEMVLPDNAPLSIINHAAAYVKNVYGSSLITDTIKTASPAI